MGSYGQRRCSSVRTSFGIDTKGEVPGVFDKEEAKRRAVVLDGIY